MKRYLLTGLLCTLLVNAANENPENTTTQKEQNSTPSSEKTVQQPPKTDSQIQPSFGSNLLAQVGLPEDFFKKGLVVSTKAAPYLVAAICLIRSNETKDLLPGLGWLKKNLIGGTTKTKRFGVTIHDKILVKQKDGSYTEVAISTIYQAWKKTNQDKTPQDFAKYFEKKYPEYKLIFEVYEQQSDVLLDKALKHQKKLGLNFDFSGDIFKKAVITISAAAIVNDCKNIWQQFLDSIQ